jgi:PDZ domain-containing protein
VRRWVYSLGIAAALLLAASAAVPTPYWIIAPGSAVELSRRIAVDGHAPSSDRFYLTDVTVTRATVLTLVAGVVPGIRVVRRSAVLPEGATQRQYDRVLVDSMLQSQGVAALVAEREAGLRVPDPGHAVVIAGILEGSPASRVLEIGDALLVVGGRHIDEPNDVARVLRGVAVGARVTADVRRGGRTVHVIVPTIATASGRRFGIRLVRQIQQPNLPVAVRYSLGNIAGSSGGLMFALQIYGSLHSVHHGNGNAIAGTGVLATDGTIGPIDGTLQKLIAAKRAGARVFLVPRENYADIAGQREIRIIPVATFREALAALRS